LLLTFTVIITELGFYLLKEISSLVMMVSFTHSELEDRLYPSLQVRQLMVFEQLLQFEVQETQVLEEFSKYPVGQAQVVPVKINPEEQLQHFEDVLPKQVEHSTGQL